MKTIGNLAGVVVGLFLMGAVLIAQNNYQKSFGGIQQLSPTDDSGSIVSYAAGLEKIALK